MEQNQWGKQCVKVPKIVLIVWSLYEPARLLRDEKKIFEIFTKLLAYYIEGGK